MSRYTLLVISFATILLVTGCSRKKSTTTINSDATAFVSNEGTLNEIPDDLASTSRYGITKISLVGRDVNVTDDGLREVRVDSGATGTGRINQIFQRLSAPNGVDQKTKLQLKQATVSVGGSRFVIPGGAALAPSFHPSNATIATSGDDLIVTAQLKKGMIGSTILIDDTLAKSYLIENPYDRFGDAIYMIPQKTTSLLMITRGSDAGWRNVSYTTGEDTYGIASLYEERGSLMYKDNNNLNVPANILLQVNPAAPSNDALIYQLDLGGSAGSLPVNLVQSLEKFPNQNALSQITGSLGGIATATPLIQNASGVYQFATSTAKEQALLIVEPTHVFILPIHNSPFTITLQNDPSEQYRPYYAHFVTNSYWLDESTMKQELGKIFGTGNVDYYTREKGFVYRIQPKQLYTGTIQARTIFGQTAKLDISYRIDDINPNAITKQILANNTISILPKSGSFKDVLVQYMNIPSFSIDFQACKITNKPELLKDYQGYGLENYLFACAGPISSTKVTPGSGEIFTYRKAYRTPVLVPAAMSGVGAFRVSFADAQGKLQVHYFMKSDIGLRTKVAGNDMYVRAFTLDDGMPVAEGEVTVSTLAGKKIGEAKLDGSMAKLTLPTPSNDYDYQNSRREQLYLVEFAFADEHALVLAHRSGADSISVPASSPDGGERYLKINSMLSPSEILAPNQQIDMRGTVEPMKIYGYTDRGLYKAGDMVYVAGFVRNPRVFGSLDYLAKKTVAVTITTPEGQELFTTGGVMLDAFGGFTTETLLPTVGALGDYIITYTLEQDPTVSYSHNIKVEEYQKPTFFADITRATNEDGTSLAIHPQYYFGEPLRSYDLQVNRSLVGKDICRYCRWWNTDQRYFNHVFNDTISTGGYFKAYNQTASTFTHLLYGPDLQINKGYAYTLKADVILKDRVSDETQFITKYIDFKPEVMIGLAGQPYEYLYKDKLQDTRAGYEIEGTIREGRQLAKKLRYEVYFRSYDQTLQPGADGNLYYLNGQGYHAVTSGNIQVQPEFTLPATFIDKPGEYFVRLMALDATDQVVGEVQKKIERYDSSTDNDGLLGSVPNNYTLKIDVPKRTYSIGEQIPVHLTPYQHDARVVVTVERGQEIIDTFLQQLSGNVLSVPVKRGYAPNIILEVMQLVGTQRTPLARQEPRFYAGYVQVDIDLKMHELEIDLKTDKTIYQPGEQVKIDITTTDSAGSPVDARVSLSVVDAALSSLYTILKEPIPYFFNKVGTSVATYTNMKLLYQSLKAFATGGSKGGAGNGGKAMFSYIRDDLKDAAFRSGAIYTKEGKTQVSFTLPENVTTWMIDALAITKDTKLGTKTAEFVVKKDLIVETNPPLYFTIGDQLEIPIKMIVASSAVQPGAPVVGSARLTNAAGDKLDLGTFTAAPNKKVALRTYVPKDRRQSPYVELTVQGHYGDLKDGTTRTIPLRSEGLVARDSVGVINTKGTHSFVFPQSLMATLDVRLAQLPTDYIDPVANYLVHYPYGCTEQILSSLLPLVALQELSATKKFSSTLLSGDLVRTQSGPVRISTALSDGLSQLLLHQHADGSFGYWANETYTEPTVSTYVLSTYVYSALETLKAAGIFTKRADDAMSSLENFLSTYGSLSNEAYLRYLYTKVAAGKTLSETEQKSADAVKQNATDYTPLLRYLIAVYSHDETNIPTWRALAHIPTNQSTWTATSVFLNPTTATALKLRASILDTQMPQLDRMQLLQSLLSLRGRDGLRGGSTQDNVQVLLTFAQIAKFRTPKKTVTCELTIDGKKQTVQVSPEGWSQHSALTTTGVMTDRSCDGLVLADTVVSYLPVRLDDLLGTAQGVTQMNRSLSDPDAKIGDTVTLAGSFSTLIAGEQLAVEMFLPSDYKLINVISTRNQPGSPELGFNGSQAPFDMSDAGCMPSHRETRFDRLFLYYENLAPITCDITIPALKAYSGSTTVMPMRLWEMYRGKVNGRKTVTR